ncbi:MAG: hypothetical protein LBJ31_04365 [Treponema sp.]|jgi:hypothetical protein|nr:hypothetical protein [Treponema sp.]
MTKAELKQVVSHPCHGGYVCARGMAAARRMVCAGGQDCADCPHSGTPVKLFTPKGAARAMMTGKVLKDCHSHFSLLKYQLKFHPYR